MDEVQLNFNPASLTVLNIILGLVMFGVALDLRVKDFKRVLTQPRAVIAGLSAQLIVLPALTWGLTMLIDVEPSVALGMILVAACPGGNMSNFISHLSGANTSLSITMTAVVTVLAIFATPFNFAFWGSLNPATAAVMQEVSVDPVSMTVIIVTLLGIPVFAGMMVRTHRPAWADKLNKPFKIGSIVVFSLFVVLALGANFQHFLTHIADVAGIVAVHNALALGVGFGIATLAFVTPADRRAITVEVGIQNSGLGLVLIFTFFDGLGGMAIITAWWGVWHLVAGLSLATFWSRRKLPQPA